MPPGRPRRRNKLPAPGAGMISHTYHPPHPVQQPPPRPQYPRPPMREEPTNNLHDEADLISFRNDALARFITNQELLENATSKFVHTAKIAPPASFPAAQPETASADAFAAWRDAHGEDVYFGSLAAMRLQSAQLERECAQLAAPIAVETVIGAQHAEYQFKKDSSAALSKLTQAMDSAAGFEALEAEYNRIIAEYRAQFGKTYKFMHSYRRQAVAPETLGVAVERAPPGYNPRALEAKQAPAPEPDMMRQYFNGNGMEFLQFEKSEQPSEPAAAPLMDDMALEDMGDMGDLINFQGQDDESLMPGQGFDDDFLSQIDHSLE